MAQKYFLYSQEQFDEKNTILSKSNKQFVAGNVVVNGKSKKFTKLSNTPTIDRFIDTQIIAYGETSKFVYTMPKTTKKEVQ